MHTKKQRTLRRAFVRALSRYHTRVLVLGMLCVAGSFLLGIEGAGEHQPITIIEAGSPDIAGDIDGSGTVDIEDVSLILEVAQGYRDATPEALRADPNGDGTLTVDDALDLLSRLRLR